jgi:hypothetical protein
MKSLFTFIGVLIVLAAIGALCYGGYLGLVYLWQVYAGLEELVRIVLLSAMAVVLLSAFIIAGAIKASGQTARKSQLNDAKLRLYQSLVEAYKPYFADSEQTSQQTMAGVCASLDALQAEMQVLSASSVLESHGKLEAALRNREAQQLVEEMFQKLVNAIRRDLGHGAHYDESREEREGDKREGEARRAEALRGHTLNNR